MKIIRDQIERATGAGEVMLTAEDPDDMVGIPFVLAENKDTFIFICP